MRLEEVEYKIDFHIEALSRILRVNINIRYVNLVAQVGFLDKSKSYDSYGI